MFAYQDTYVLGWLVGCGVQVDANMQPTCPVQTSQVLIESCIWDTVSLLVEHSAEDIVQEVISTPVNIYIYYIHSYTLYLLDLAGCIRLRVASKYTTHPFRNSPSGIRLRVLNQQRILRSAEVIGASQPIRPIRRAAPKAERMQRHHISADQGRTKLHGTSVFRSRQHPQCVERVHEDQGMWKAIGLVGRSGGSF